MEKFAYKAPNYLRPNRYPNLRAEASKPWMGITTFVKDKPWLVIGYDGDKYILENEDGEFLKLKEFAWNKATEQSALVAASRVEDSPIPYLPLSFDEDWSLKVAEEEFPIGEVVAGLEEIGWNKSSFQGNELEWPTKDYKEYSPEHSKEDTSFKSIDKISCPYCEHSDVRQSFLENYPYRCNNCGENFGAKESHEVGERDDEQNDPTACPHCGGHTLKLIDKSSSEFHCLTCGKNSTQDVMFNPQGHIAYEVDKGQKDRLHPYPYAPPGVENPKCHSCGYSWKDNHKFQLDKQRCPECGAATKLTSLGFDRNGEELKVGKPYLMHSPKYKIPDLVRILKAEPTMVEAALEGSEKWPIKIKEKDYADMMYSFEPFISGRPPQAPTQVAPETLEQIRNLFRGASDKFDQDPNSENYEDLIETVDNIVYIWNQNKQAKLSWDYTDTTDSMGGRDTGAPIRENPLDYDENVINQSETASPPNTPTMGMPHFDEGLELHTPRGTVHRMTGSNGPEILVLSNGKGGIMGWAPYNGEQDFTSVKWDTGDLHKIEQAIGTGMYTDRSSANQNFELDVPPVNTNPQQSFQCPHCGSSDVYLNPRSPTPLGKCWSCQKPFRQDTPDNVPGDFTLEQGGIPPQSEDYYRGAKLARKSFSPTQQKELIDENLSSVARNIEKLNISNSHYEKKEVEDDHLWLW